jgi:hypothetical protein
VCDLLAQVIEAADDHFSHGFAPSPGCRPQVGDIVAQFAKSSDLKPYRAAV